MIRINPSIAIHEDELEFSFVRASGPGGQKVNKTSTAVQLRFDAQGSPGLSEEVRHRLRQLAGRRMSSEGVIVIEASRHRSQKQNRDEAVQRLLVLLRAAGRPARQRHPTRPAPRQRERRLQHKHERSEIKRWRRPPATDG